MNGIDCGKCGKTWARRMFMAKVGAGLILKPGLFYILLVGGASS